MRNVALATILAAAMVLPAQAQFRGGMGGGFRGGFAGGFRGGMASGFRGGFVAPRTFVSGGVGRLGARPTGFPPRTFAFRPSHNRLIIRTVPNPFFFNPLLSNRSFFRGRFGFRHHRGFFGFNPFFGFGAFPGFFGGWGGWGWPGWDSSYSSGVDYTATAEQQQLAAEVDDLVRELRAERLQRLEEEEQDREEQNQPARPSATAPRAAPAERPSPPTVLVFKDGHRTEVQNYVIVPDALYVFAANGTRKIPLSDLDVAATVRANDERGVEFRVPRMTASS